MLPSGLGRGRLATLTAWPRYMEGAIASGERAATEILGQANGATT